MGGFLAHPHCGLFRSIEQNSAAPVGPFADSGDFRSADHGTNHDEGVKERSQRKADAMATITVSNEIAAPVHQVFESFTDIGSGASHVSGIKKIAMLTTGKFGLGTRWIETREVLGVPDSAEMEVTSFERDKTYTITHHKGGVRIDTAFWFEPAGGQATKVTVEFELDSGGLPPGLLAPLNWAIAGKVRDVIGHDLADLKTSLEK
jgi:polyketide cyclase/dehydrase/lipid transport protein